MKSARVISLLTSSKTEEEMAKTISEWAIESPEFFLNATYLKRSLFHHLVTIEKMEVFQRLLAIDTFKALAFRQDPDTGYSVLHYAIQVKKADRPELLEPIFRQLPELLNAQDQNGNTALHLAILNRNLAATCLLVNQLHINRCQTNNSGDSPFDLAKHDPQLSHLLLRVNPAHIPTQMLATHLRDDDERTLAFRNEFPLLTKASSPTPVSSSSSRERVGIRIPLRAGLSDSSSSLSTASASSSTNSLSSSTNSLSTSCGSESDSPRSVGSFLFFDSAQQAAFPETMLSADAAAFKRDLISQLAVTELQDDHLDAATHLSSAELFGMLNQVIRESTSEREVLYRNYLYERQTLQKEATSLLIINGLLVDAPPMMAVPDWNKILGKIILPQDLELDYQMLDAKLGSLKRQHHLLLQSNASDDSALESQRNEIAIQIASLTQQVNVARDVRTTRARIEMLWLACNGQDPSRPGREYDLPFLNQQCLGLQFIMPAFNILAYLRLLYPLFDKQQKLAASYIVWQSLDYTYRNKPELIDALLPQLSLFKKQNALLDAGLHRPAQSFHALIDALVAVNNRLNHCVLIKNHRQLNRWLQYPYINQSCPSFHGLVLHALSLPPRKREKALSRLAHELHQRSRAFYQNLDINDLKSSAYVSAHARYLNQVGDYFTMLLLEPPSGYKIVHVYSFLIQLAHALFVSSMDGDPDLGHVSLIVSVFNQSCISRLEKRHLASLSKEDLALRQELMKLFDLEKNSRWQRESSAVHSGTLPFPGLISSDVTMASENSVLFNSCLVFGKILPQLLHMKERFYLMPPGNSTNLLVFFKDYEMHDSDTLYAISTRWEESKIEYIVLDSAQFDLKATLADLQSHLQTGLIPNVRWIDTPVKLYPPCQLPKVLVKMVEKAMAKRHQFTPEQKETWGNNLDSLLQSLALIHQLCRNLPADQVKTTRRQVKHLQEKVGELRKELPVTVKINRLLNFHSPAASSSDAPDSPASSSSATPEALPESFVL